MTLSSLVGKHQVDGDELTPKTVNIGTSILAGVPFFVGYLTGVTLVASDADGDAVCDLERKVWRFDIINVLTYNASTGAAETWTAVTVGARVYVNPSNQLVLSPLHSDGTANRLFGVVVGSDAALSGTATAHTEPNVHVLHAAE